jgi:hypothetical protein
MPLFIFFDTETIHFKPIILVHCYVFPKNHLPRRDSNPGLLFLRRMRCPLRHADRTNVRPVSFFLSCTGLGNYLYMFYLCYPRSFSVYSGRNRLFLQAAPGRARLDAKSKPISGGHDRISDLSAVHVVAVVVAAAGLRRQRARLRRWCERVAAVLSKSNMSKAKMSK